MRRSWKSARKISTTAEICLYMHILGAISWYSNAYISWKMCFFEKVWKTSKKCFYIILYFLIKNLLGLVSTRVNSCGSDWFDLYPTRETWSCLMENHRSMRQLPNDLSCMLSRAQRPRLPHAGGDGVGLLRLHLLRRLSLQAVDTAVDTSWHGANRILHIFTLFFKKTHTFSTNVKKHTFRLFDVFALFHIISHYRAVRSH